MLHENIHVHCRFSGTPDSRTDANSGQISYQATIYCAPDLTVPAGCHIAVQQYGVTYRLKYSGESVVYPTHQQLSAVQEETSVMASWGSCDFHELRDLNERIKAAASEQEMDAFYTGLLDEMMNGLLTDVKELTPVDRGHLRRNWFTTKARRSGKHYRAEIYNNIEYAPYVENGHRQEVGRYVPAIGKRLVRSFVEEGI